MGQRKILFLTGSCWVSLMIGFARAVEVIKKAIFDEGRFFCWLYCNSCESESIVMYLPNEV